MMNHNRKQVNIQLKKTYGITIDEYHEMLAEQDGVCRICRKQNPCGKSLYVDHNHKNGKVRFLLCNSCNVKMGWLNGERGIKTASGYYSCDFLISLIQAGVAIDDFVNEIKCLENHQKERFYNILIENSFYMEAAKILYIKEDPVINIRLPKESIDTLIILMRENKASASQIIIDLLHNCRAKKK